MLLSIKIIMMIFSKKIIMMMIMIRHECFGASKHKSTFQAINENINIFYIIKSRIVFVLIH